MLILQSDFLDALSGSEKFGILMVNWLICLPRL